MDKKKKYFKKLYDKKIDNTFLFKFEKDEEQNLKKNDIKYYIKKNNKIIEINKK